MKVLIQTSENSDGAMIQKIVFNDTTERHFYPLYECPEDATLERDMTNADDIAAYIKMGYDAAKRGEDLEIIKEDVEELE